jgi:hypothetical protein
VQYQEKADAVPLVSRRGLILFDIALAIPYSISVLPYSDDGMFTSSNNFVKSDSLNWIHRSVNPCPRLWYVMNSRNLNFQATTHNNFKSYRIFLGSRIHRRCFRGVMESHRTSLRQTRCLCPLPCYHTVVWYGKVASGRRDEQAPLSDTDDLESCQQRRSVLKPMIWFSASDDTLFLLNRLPSR